MEAVVVGGGPAGLAAALRLALCGKRVGLWERHDRLGGMNSWYLRKGITLDTGLHALTNLAPPQESAAPLNLLLRQLRIRRPELRLTPQVRSRISFPSGELLLTNDFPALVGQVQRLFPQEAQGFLALAEEMRRLGYGAAPTLDRSANALLERHIASPLLRDMLRLPVFFYGNPTPEDMEATAFATMFRSIFLEGLGRPMGGMRPFLETLETHLRRENVALHLGEGVRKILLDKQGRTRGILTDHGTTVEAPLVVSTIGAWETAALCPPGTCPTRPMPPRGNLLPGSDLHPPATPRKIRLPGRRPLPLPPGRILLRPHQSRGGQCPPGLRTGKLPGRRHLTRSPTPQGLHPHRKNPLVLFIPGGICPPKGPPRPGPPKIPGHRISPHGTGGTPPGCLHPKDAPPFHGTRKRGNLWLPRKSPPGRPNAPGTPTGRNRPGTPGNRRRNALRRPGRQCPRQTLTQHRRNTEGKNTEGTEF